MNTNRIYGKEFQSTSDIKEDYKKQDKQFMIQFDQTNRDFLKSTATFILSFAISMISLLISVLAIIYVLDGVTVYSITVTVIFCIILIIMSVTISAKYSGLINCAKNINKQLQERLFELYPEYKNKYH